MDPDEDPLRPVVLDDRLGLPVEDVEPVPDHLRRVVASSLCNRPPVQPVDRDVVGDLEVEHDGHAALELVEQPVESLRLRQRPREPVEDEAGLGVRPREPLADQLDHELVGYEVAAVVRPP